MAQKAVRQQGLERHIRRIDHRLDALAQRSSRYAWARLATFLIALIAGVSAGAALGVRWGFVAFALGLVAFGVVARIHTRIHQTITRFQLWRAIKAGHVARMTLDWSGIPPALLTVPRDDCPLELDLDLVGDRGLHRLLDVGVSREGSLRLRDWLVTVPPDPARIRARQALVREMVPLALFRDKLTLNAMVSTTGRHRRWDGRRVLEWVKQHESPESLRMPLRWLTLLALVNAALFALTLVGILPPLWGFTFMLYAAGYLLYVQRLGDPFDLGLALRDPLIDLGAVFEFLETYRYGRKAALRDLCAPFVEGDQCPSVQLRRLTRVLSAASVRRNPLLWTMLSAVIPWDVYVAYWLNKRRAEVAALLPVWLDVWFELEALNSLATCAYLNPAYTFPVVRQRHDGDLLAGRHIGHPLIPDSERVCNDFALGQPGELAMVTGSNMSGKSTFLRTLGVNLCLAYAGGPVVARAFDAVPLRLFTCVRVTDSLSDGISFFYAEVKRLKALLDALDANHGAPLFYLIDEIFRGTNNRERLIGSRAYIRALVARDGVGVLSTHDLELVGLADEVPQIRNFHFEETIVEGRMAFDYTLRPGPCPTTNALKIMRMEGLPVDPGA